MGSPHDLFGLIAELTDDRIAFDMINELKNLFQTQAIQELYDTQRQLNACKMEEGQSVTSHVLKMKSYIDKFEHLGHHMPHVLADNIVLCSLPNLFDNFVMNYNMRGWDKDGGVKRKSWKKRKGNFKYRKKVPLSLKKESVAKDAECFPCENIGHRKRNHPCYLVELKRSKQTGLSGNRKASGSPL
ncbi:hypothetical protein Tco_0999222 [Tanacetum coccineum]